MTIMRLRHWRRVFSTLIITLTISPFNETTSIGMAIGKCALCATLVGVAIVLGLCDCQKTKRAADTTVTLKSRAISELLKLHNDLREKEKASNMNVLVSTAKYRQGAARYIQDRRNLDGG